MANANASRLTMFSVHVTCMTSMIILNVWLRELREMKQLNGFHTLNVAYLHLDRIVGRLICALIHYVTGC